jgi:hypothetical protein
MLEMIAICTTAVVFTAKQIPPNNFVSFLFNVWAGIMLFAITSMAKPILCALFFPEIISSECPKPIGFYVITSKNGSTIKHMQYEKNPSSEKVMAFLFEKILSESTENAATNTITPDAPTNQPPKSPGTPHSELSGASTEPIADTMPAKGCNGPSEGQIEIASD